MSETNTEYSTNIIHESLGSKTEFWGEYTLAELALFVVPIFGYFLFLGIPFVPASAFLPATGAVIALEILLFALFQVKPSYYRLTEWLMVRLRFAVQKEKHTIDDGNQDTRHVTRLKRIMPHGIERIDGAHVGAVEVRPANMALEDGKQWANAVSSLTDLVTALEGTAEIYVTTTNVSNRPHIEAHEERLQDPDVQSLPMLRGVLSQWVNRYTNDDGEIQDSTEMQREYYIIITVTDSDIDELERESTSLLGYFEDLPGIGRAVSKLTPETFTDAEREKYKAKKLNDRLGNVSRAVDNLYRCRGNAVSPFDLAQLTKDYWACESRPHSDFASTAGISPISYSDDQDNGGDDVNDALTAEDLADDDDADTAPADAGDTEETEAKETEAREDLEHVEEAGEEIEYISPDVSQPGRKHQSIVAPTAIDWQTDYTLIENETYARTFWIETFPEHPTNGLFERLLLDTDLRADVNIHVDPYDSQDAVQVMSEWITSLRMVQNDMGELEAEDIRDDINRAKYLRQLVRRNRASLYQAGVFVRITADSKEELRTQTNQLETLLRDAPANCSVKRATRRQEQGMVTVSPLGGNELGRGRLSAMTGEALGSMFPFSSNYLRMEDGIEYGTHGHNGSSLLIDPWELETGHSELVTGMPGGGKSHGTQARSIRMMKKRSDVKQVFIDPVAGMRGSAKMLNAKTITVSGETPLNPCEMHPTPEHILRKSPDMQPVASKKDEVFGVIENFLKSRNIDLEMHSGLITFLIDAIFEQSDIDPDDPSTHTPENSPSMADFLDLIDDIQEDPSLFPGATTESSRQKIREYANELSVALHPFRQGSTYGNLSEESNLNLIEDDSKAVYLDLQQIEGSGSGLGKQSFIMQLLLSNLYQQAKNMDQKVEIIIDEAHYLFNDDANLAFLNQIARHQRHAGLRLVMLSQTLQEFYDEGVAEEIAGMCPIMVHHREPDLGEKTANRAGLTSEQQHYINTAEAGKESIGEGQGFSQALVRVDEHGDYPLTIRTSWEEKRVIDLDAHGRDALAALVDSQPEQIKEFEQFVYAHGLRHELTERFGFEPEQAEKVLSGLSQEELMDSVRVALEQNGTATAVADGGSTDTTTADTGGSSE
ncbi:VirB4 family type IV secretion system protein [Haloarcula halophila]|uniref:VirB4 family type IV secretion system protein n=1 Tax=Haloarcula TaxID=2237 RepID=UPI0023E43769|nr:conjugal transfer protein [Halomicroarcula sp. DFY41]